MAAICNRAGHYIVVLWILSFFFLSSFFVAWCQRSQIGCLPYFYTWCGPNANLECRSEMSCNSLEMQDPKIAKNSPSWHHRTTFRAMSSQQRHMLTVDKNLLNSNIPRTCPQNMVNFGLLAAEICWQVWGTTANFKGFLVLAALLYGTSSGRQPNFAALNRCRHLYSAGRPITLDIGPHSSYILHSSLVAFS